MSLPEQNLTAAVSRAVAAFKARHPGFQPGALKGLGHPPRRAIASRMLAAVLGPHQVTSSLSVQVSKDAYNRVAVAPSELLELLAAELGLPPDLLGSPA